MFKSNKQQTALSLLTVSFITETAIAPKEASAQTKSN